MNRFKPRDKNLGAPSFNRKGSTGGNGLDVGTDNVEEILKLASKDKLRVLSQTMIDMLLNFSTEYDFKVMHFCIHLPVL